MSNMNQSLAEAADLFVMTKFDQCFSICSKVINSAKCEPEEERNGEIIEAATALGIQALAETDLWHHVITFITEVYGNVELCPPRIIQVCILLHAHVKEYLPCHKLVQMWLKSPQNLNHKQCSQVIRIYAHHILCPTGSYETLKDIVQSCSSLTDAERSALLQLPQTERFEDMKRQSLESERRRQDEGSPLKTSVESNGSDTNHLQDPAVTSSVYQQDISDDNNNAFRSKKNTSAHSHDKYKGAVGLQVVVKKFWNVIVICFTHLRQRFGLIAMGVIAVIALFHTQTGDPVSSLGRMVILWRTFLQRLGLLNK